MHHTYTHSTHSTHHTVIGTHTRAFGLSTLFEDGLPAMHCAAAVACFACNHEAHTTLQRLSWQVTDQVLHVAAFIAGSVACLYFGAMQYSVCSRAGPWRNSRMQNGLVGPTPLHQHLATCRCRTPRSHVALPLVLVSAVQAAREGSSCDTHACKMAVLLPSPFITSCL